jgi:hypothetical protein
MVEGETVYRYNRGGGEPITVHTLGGEWFIEDGLPSRVERDPHLQHLHFNALRPVRCR